MMEVTSPPRDVRVKGGTALATVDAKTTDQRRASFSNLNLSHPPLHPKRSAASINEQRLRERSDSEDGKRDDSGEVEVRRGRFVRTKSKTSIELNSAVRYGWTENLWTAEAFQTSVKELKLSYDEFYAEATSQNWRDLLELHKRFHDRGDLERLAREVTNKKSSSRKHDTGDLTNLEKISHVALEYSKMLEVVVNQSPEYACLAWAVSVAPCTS